MAVKPKHVRDREATLGLMASIILGGYVAGGRSPEMLAGDCTDRALGLAEGLLERIESKSKKGGKKKQ